MPPPPPQAASIVPSSNPSADADFILRLLPGRFVLSPSDLANQSNTSCVTLIGGTSSTLVPPTAIIFVDFGGYGGDDSISSTGLAVVPSASLILEDADLIASAASKSEFAGGTIRSSSSACTNGGDSSSSSSWVIVRLSGGGAVLLASSVQGLYDYANKVTAGSDVEQENRSSALIDIDIGEAEADTRSLGGAAAVAAAEEPPYKFPSLALSILCNKDVVPGFPINTRVGVPIESDLFVGQVLLIMRPPNPADDPYYNDKVFSKKRRRFEIQIQGRLKYVPTGTVWCGFEVTEEMKLGLVSKGLCNLLLRLVSKTVPGDMHFSFGDKNNEELPHISFPAWTLFDAVVVTKPGEEKPTLGDVLPESAKSASARKRSGSTGDWNTDDTYSFSYHSMYLDLPIWHVVNLPTSDIDLKSFWRDSLLRIVVYESNAQGDKHLQRDNKYIAGIQAEYLGFDDESINDMIEEQDALPLDQKRLSKISRSISYINLEPGADDSRNTGTSLSPGLDGLAWDNSTIESDDETTFYDATGVPRTESENSLLNGGQLFVEMNTFDEKVQASYVARETPRNLLLYDMLCPGWIDVCSERGNYTKVYAFSTGDGGVVFRTSSEFGQLFSVAQAKIWADEACSPRLSSAEKHRRILGYTLSACLHSPSAQSEQRCQALRNQKDCRCDNVFLQQKPPTDSKTKAKDQFIYAGYVGRALSERHWVEEWAVVTNRFVSFFHPDSKRPSFRIYLKGILCVRKLQDPSECPHFPSYHFIVIETVSREVYLMFCSGDDCEKMLSVLVEHHETQGRIVPTMAEANLTKDLAHLTFDDPTEEYLHKSTGELQV